MVGLILGEGYRSMPKKNSLEVMNYENVINSLLKKRRVPHLLLGNGFSIAYNNQIFSYNSLYKFLETLNDEFLQKLFDVIKTKNFELVMRQLDTFAELLEAFDSNPELALQMRDAKHRLKESLINALNSLHPEHVFTISENECDHCSKFLAPYIENGGNIFSTNYDILLYWVLMRCEISNCIDGFGRDREDDPDDFESDPAYSELRWGKHKEEQNIHYLHGALPFFDTGIEIIKEEYTGNGYLLNNIRQRIEQGHYPVFVTAGNGEEKLSHIRHNQYLSFCYDSLESISGSLVTFGFNFGEYDHHIIDAINKASLQEHEKRLWSIYIGVYSETDEAHIRSIENKFKCKVNIFDAKTAPVWRST